MQEEFNALIKNNTWEFEPYSGKNNTMSCKWGFRVKYNADGPLQRHKAQLVAKEFQQNPCIDFSETYSPTIKASTIRVVLAIIVNLGWQIRQQDINNVFLNGKLQDNLKDFKILINPITFAKL